MQLRLYTPMEWAWSDVQVLQRQQIQTPARRTVSTRRTRHTVQRQTESMDIDPGCSNTQPSNVKACNTTFKYDYQVQEVLDWQQVSKPKRNTNATLQAQCKIQLHLSLLKYWRYPCSKAWG